MTIIFLFEKYKNIERNHKRLYSKLFWWLKIGSSKFHVKHVYKYTRRLQKSVKTAIGFISCIYILLYKSINNLFQIHYEDFSWKFSKTKCNFAPVVNIEHFFMYIKQLIYCFLLSLFASRDFHNVMGGYNWLQQGHGKNY